MPLYQYIEGGKLVERVLPIGERDRYPNRVTVPARINVCPRGEPNSEAQAMRGFYREEQRDPQFNDRFPFTPKQVREAWGMDRSTANAHGTAPEREVAYAGPAAGAAESEG